MRPFGQSRRAQRQAGSVAVVAAAIIVIVGFIGVAMMTSMRLTGSNTTNHILATQSHYTADAGVEWACKQDSATGGAVSFASGTFEVTADGDEWVSVAEADQTKRTMECEPEEVTPPMATGIEYALESRDGGKYDVKFYVMNTSDADITFNKLKVTWSNPSAYFEEVKIKVENGTDYHEVWEYEDEPDEYRWGSGETKQFTQVSNATVPAHHIAKIELKGFKKYQTGGSKRNMQTTEVTVDFYNGSTNVGQITVGLAPN